ncbi:MAG TPA: hypothetical protein VKV79_07325, partial [Terriglobia bacterium]|nr:hypothetical protein [Terriglobia bacterium]
MNSQVSFGPLTNRIVKDAKWRRRGGAPNSKTDDYPSSQAWSDECEQLLGFAQDHGVFDKYLPRLQEDPRQRDAALAELRVASFLDSKGYKPQIGTWKPDGGRYSDGEFKILDRNGASIVVEIKHRTWQSELTDKEIQGGRAKEPKYLGAEARPLDPRKAIQGAIEKAYAKFKDQTPSLLVVTDNLFISLGYFP